MNTFNINMIRRYKTPEANLKLKYRKTLELGLIVSLLILIGLFRTLQHIKIHPKEIKVHPFIIRVEHIPQTEQIVPRTRPELPIATEDEKIPLEVTIKSTELDSGIEAGFVFVPYDEPPLPIGGMAAIKQRIKYPELALKSGIEGTVILGVLVDENGKVMKTEILQDSGLNVGFEKAAEEAVMTVKWKPAMQRDRKVKVWVSIPIHFRLQQDKENT